MDEKSTRRNLHVMVKKLEVLLRHIFNATKVTTEMDRGLWLLKVHTPFITPSTTENLHALSGVAWCEAKPCKEHDGCVLIHIEVRAKVD